MPGKDRSPCSSLGQYGTESKHNSTGRITNCWWLLGNPR